MSSAAPTYWKVHTSADGRGHVAEPRTGEVFATFENIDAAWAAVRAAQRLTPLPQPKAVRQ